MTINLKSLRITNYDSTISDDVKFLEEIKKDEEISKHLEDAPDSLERSNGIRNLRLDVAYLVKDEEKAIGLIRLAKKYSDKHDISVDIAIHPRLRKKGYGTILLREISDYIFRNSTLIKKIKLDVESTNEPGAKCAISADFKLDAYIDYPDSKGHLLYSKRK